MDSLDNKILIDFTQKEERKNKKSISKVQIEAAAKAGVSLAELLVPTWEWRESKWVWASNRNRTHSRLLRCCSLYRDRYWLSPSSLCFPSPTSLSIPSISPPPPPFISRPIQMSSFPISTTRRRCFGWILPRWKRNSRSTYTPTATQRRITRRPGSSLASTPARATSSRTSERVGSVRTIRIKLTSSSSLSPATRCEARY